MSKDNYGVLLASEVSLDMSVKHQLCGFGGEPMPVVVQGDRSCPNLLGRDWLGFPGGRLGCEAHGRRLLQMAKGCKPEQVVLVIGGNDLCGRDFDLPHLSKELYTLGLGLAALGDLRPTGPVPGDDKEGGRHTGAVRGDALPSTAYGRHVSGMPQ